MKKAKAVNVVMVFGILITLIFLQISCGTMKEHRADAEPAGVEPAEVEETAEGGDLLLANKHTANGVDCSDCHGGQPFDSQVSQDTCLTCHEDYREVAASYLDPHNAHVAYPDCGYCHHAHRPGEMICQECHNFNLQAP